MRHLPAFRLGRCTFTTVDGKGIREMATPVVGKGAMELVSVVDPTNLGATDVTEFEQDAEEQAQLAALGAEAADDEVEDEETTEAAEPTAEAQDEPTDRRSQEPSRRAGKEKTSVDLTASEDFRRFQAERDREREELKKQIEAERKQRAQYEAQVAEYQRQQDALQLAALNQKLADGMLEPTEQARVIEEIAERKAAAKIDNWQRQVNEWRNYVDDRVRAEGLDPAQFDPGKYHGPEGALSFERDIFNTKNAKLQSELEAYKRTSSPEALAEEVQKQVARALQKAGLNKTDTGEVRVTTPQDGEAKARDQRLLNQGRMPREEFLKKWGGR